MDAMPKLARTLGQLHGVLRAIEETAADGLLESLDRVRERAGCTTNERSDARVKSSVSATARK